MKEVGRAEEKTEEHERENYIFLHGLCSQQYCADLGGDLFFRGFILKR